MNDCEEDCGEEQIEIQELNSNTEQEISGSDMEEPFQGPCFVGKDGTTKW